MKIYTGEKKERYEPCDLVYLALNIRARVAYYEVSIDFMTKLEPYTAYSRRFAAGGRHGSQTWIY